MPKTVKESPAVSAVSAGYAANMRGVAAVDRALSIAIALETAKEPLTLSQVSAATGLYKSAVLRLMVSLERCGLVARRSDQSYVLGALAFRFGKAYESVSHLEETLLPLMHELVAQGMESPSFHVFQDAETRLCLLRIDSNHSTLDRVRAGDVLPLKKGAAGKVLRSRQPSSPVDDAQSLIETSFGERDASCAAVAGPVYGPGGELLGALSLSGPLERFTAASVKKMSVPLLYACEEATRKFGGTWPAAGMPRATARRRAA
ncbi:MAG: IclR family transcriptional regulator [Ramlibacter sp.]